MIVWCGYIIYCDSFWLGGLVLVCVMFGLVVEFIYLFMLYNNLLWFAMLLLIIGGCVFGWG